MKKVVSLLVAFATAIGVSVSAFAAQDDVTGFSNDVVFIDENGTVSSNSDTTFSPSTRVNYGSSGISLTHNEIVLVENNTTASIIMPETHLEPNKDYVFRIYKVNANQPNIAPGEANVSPVTNNMLGGGKLRLRGIKGTSAINSAKIVQKGTGASATFNVEIKTKGNNWGTKITDVIYQLSASGNTTNQNGYVDLLTGEFLFRAGYRQMSDEDVDSYSEGDIITVYKDYPVFTKSQMETIAKNYNYKAVQFEAENGVWSYLGRVSGMGDTNFSWSHDVTPAIVERFEDQNFEFLTFGAGVKFPTNGEMRIDVSDYDFEGNRLYVYLYRDGKLTPVSTTFDTGADEIVFRTNYLGSFVITDEQVTDTTILESNQAPVVPEEETNNGVTNNQNPSTGAASGLNIAVALGIASIAAAGVSSKRK